MTFIFEGFIHRTYEGWFICETKDDIDPMAHGIDPFSIGDVDSEGLNGKQVKVTVEILDNS